MRAKTTPAVTSSQRRTWAKESKPSKFPLPPGVAACFPGIRKGTYSPSRRSNDATKPMPPTIVANKGANTGGPISTL